MKTTTYTAQRASHAPSMCEEVRIHIECDQFINYTGSSGALVADGLIPDGFEWPHKGDCRTWTDGGFRYSLERRKPAGMKGHRRDWICMDHWSLMVHPIQVGVPSYHLRRAYERKKHELDALRYAMTTDGSYEACEASRKSMNAVKDQAFQAFKAKIIPKRGRGGEEVCHA